MLKLTVRAGEYLLIGEDIKLVFAGGSSNNMHILIDAPRDFNIARSEALKKHGITDNFEHGISHHKDRDISEEAKKKIRAILMEERKKGQPLAIGER